MVTNKIFRGGRPKDESQMRILRARGIRTIVNVQGYGTKLIKGEKESEIKEAEENAKRAGLRFIHMPFTTAAKIDEEQRATMIEIARIMNDPQLQPVYVHCNVGVDPTGVAVAAWRILYQGCSYRQAKSELLKHGRFWTGILTRPNLKVLKDFAANQRAISGTITQTCALPATDDDSDDDQGNDEATPNEQ